VFFFAAIGLNVNPLARETISFANTHFQSRRLFPEQGASQIGKKVEC
jgi:hypothetical protein